MAELLRTLGVVMVGAALITPAFTQGRVEPMSSVWVIVALMLITFGLILMPSEG